MQPVTEPFSTTPSWPCPKFPTQLTLKPAQAAHTKAYRYMYIVVSCLYITHGAPPRVILLRPPAIACPSSHVCERDALSIANLEGEGAWDVLCVPKDEERGGGGAREVHGDVGPLLGVGEGERLLRSEAAAGLVDDQHEASVRRPHLARGRCTVAR